MSEPAKGKTVALQLYICLLQILTFVNEHKASGDHRAKEHSVVWHCTTSTLLIPSTVLIWPTGLGHFGRSCCWYTVRVRCVLALVTVSRDRLIWVPRSHHSWHVVKIEDKPSPAPTGLGLSPSAWVAPF